MGIAPTIGGGGADKSWDEILGAGMGLLGWTAPKDQALNTTILVDGTVYFVAMPLRVGTLVSKVWVAPSAGGATFTLAKLGLYDKLGNKLAATADLAQALTATGPLSGTLATPYSVPADDLYYGAIVVKASVTLPTLFRVGTSTVLNGAIGSGARQYGTQAGQTDLPTAATIVNSSVIGVWMGVS